MDKELPLEERLGEDDVRCFLSMHALEMIDGMNRANTMGEMVDEALKSTSEIFRASCYMSWDEDSNGRFRFSQHAGKSHSGGIRAKAESLLKESYEYLRVLDPSSEDGDNIMMAPYVVFPLQVKMNQDERKYGSIMVMRDNGCNSPFTKDEVNTLFKLKRALASRLDSFYNASIAEKDGLTGLYTKRKFSEFLEDQVRRARRNYERKPLSLIMVDLDHFKNINDGLGHLQGDYVLQELAEMMMEHPLAKEYYLPARWGGEEFGILMPMTEVEEAKEFADTLKKDIALHYFRNIRNDTDQQYLSESTSEDEAVDFAASLETALERKKEAEKEGQEYDISRDINTCKPIRMTCSIGVGRYLEDESHREFINAIDEALYAAKRQRNMVCMAEEPRYCKLTTNR